MKKLLIAFVLVFCLLVFINDAKSWIFDVEIYRPGIYYTPTYFYTPIYLEPVPVYVAPTPIYIAPRPLCITPRPTYIVHRWVAPHCDLSRGFCPVPEYRRTYIVPHRFENHRHGGFSRNHRR